MSEFKEFEINDWVKANDGQFGFNELFKIVDFFADRNGTLLAVLDDGDCHPLSCLEHASEAEIKAGHRIDGPIDQVFKDAVEHGHGFAMVSIEGVEQVSIAHVINPFPCEELGDDSHIENHISPLCKSKDV